jgi:N6-adenosine-specific RNA methylase IME4
MQSVFGTIGTNLLLVGLDFARNASKTLILPANNPNLTEIVDTLLSNEDLTHDFEFEEPTFIVSGVTVPKKVASSTAISLKRSRYFHNLSRNCALNSKVISSQDPDVPIFEGLDEPLEIGPFDLIVADPPWKYPTPFTATQRHFFAAEQYYPTLTQEEMKELPVADLADPKRACLLLWAPGAMLDQAITLMKHWGFEYKGVLFIWIKTDKENKNPVAVPTSATMNAIEHLIYGVRGNFFREFRENASILNFFTAPRGSHSTKPSIHLNEKLTELFGQENYQKFRKIELFARQIQTGWTCWGNEIENKH